MGIEKQLAPFTFKRFESAEGSAIPEELHLIYRDFNGGLFWDGALLVRPYQGGTGLPSSVIEWNRQALWKCEYNGLLSDVEFFAEDVFGIQFGIRAAQVIQFDPETAETILISETVDGWSRELLRDPAFYTGFPVLHAWEQLNGPLPLGNRLIPKQLFMLGGEFKPPNLVSKPDVEGMRIRGQLWRMMKNLPNGARIKFEIVD